MPSTQNYITQDAGDARYQTLGGLSSATPTTVDAGDTGTAGVSSSGSRADHEHPVSVTSAQLVPAAWLAAWTSYTPTLTQSGAVTKTVAYAKYIQMGKTVIAQISLACTGAGTAANAVVAGLPVAAGATRPTVIGSGYIYDASVDGVFKANVEFSGASAVVFRPTTTTANDFLGTAVFTAALAAGDLIVFSVTYEAA